MNKKPKRNINSITRRRIRSKKIINFNKWFKKEHDYCLPYETNDEIIDEKKDYDELNKSLDIDSALSNKSKNTYLKKINVNNKLSSCSLYAIDLTTELLKDALLENQKKQNHDLSSKTKDVNSSTKQNMIKSDIEKPNIIQHIKLENENILHTVDERNQDLYLFDQCTPTKLLLENDISGSPMEIDELGRLFPILDYQSEHCLKEKLDDNELYNTSSNQHASQSEIKPQKDSEICTVYDVHPSSPSPLFETNNRVAKSCINVSKPAVHNNLPSPTRPALIRSPSRQYLNIFNRYQGRTKEYFVEQTEDPSTVLLKDLLCGSKPKTIISPYTHRYLKPYIFKDPDTKPLWLQMLKDIRKNYKIKNKLPVGTETETIDYSYVRAKHINSVNLLAREHFWPGIDMTDSLLYPDFSVVALYKNLVVGFGFMVPDISTNENYITFLFTRPHWTNCGIATFMLYHLIQTCMTRDITLHVSPTNSALFLYQKFGFKIEEFVQNFYDKYIPGESNMSKHALFLRLRSTLRSK
ncbi:uncharacterized protein LOC126841139 [Adelges cooleyi]|uniref:uncharacterized protein LOC126841139 n=1 Tax=Adelges cooleyi TaxID=133065 RepID=UPI00217F98EE|nr:uncharacterized protein LOC126841139 [Adelges cooleyi]